MTQWWLSRRLAWRLALVLLAAVALAAVAVGWRAIVTARSLEDASLQAQVAAVAGGLVVGPNGTPRLDLPSDLTAAFEASHGTSVFVVTDQSAEPLLSSELARRCTSCTLPPGARRVVPGPGLGRLSGRHGRFCHALGSVARRSGRKAASRAKCWSAACSPSSSPPVLCCWR